MPFDDNSFNPEDEEQSKSQGGGSSPAGGVISAGAPGGGGASGNPSNPSAPTSSGSFTNLQNYLDANQGNNLAGQLSGNIQNQIGQANSAQQNLDSNFRSQVDKSTINSDDSLVKSAVSDPTKFTQDPNNINAFQTQLNASYKGPTNLQSDQNNWNSAQQATQNALQQAQAGQTEGGRFALLDQYFGNPSYSQGQKNLDQFLVQSDPNAAGSFNSAYQDANAAGKKFNDIQAADQAYATGAQNATQTAASNAKNALTGAAGNLNTSVSGQQTSDQTAQDQAYQALLAQLGDANQVQQAPSTIADYINTTLGQQEGSLPGSNSFVYGIDPSKFLSEGGPVSIGAAATADQQAAYNALGQLAGTNSSLVAPQSWAGATDSKYDPSQAYNFNQGGFSSAVSGQKGAYNTTLNQYQQQIAQLQAAQAKEAATGGLVVSRQPDIDAIQHQIDQLNRQYGLATPYSKPGRIGVM